MWFKNIFAFKLNEEQYDDTEFQGQLEDKKIKPCGKNDLESFGWTPIFDDEDELFQKVSGAYVLKFKQEKKNIPNKVVQERLKNRIKEHFKETGQKPNREEKDNFKEAIILEMAQTAFVESSYINGYLDFKNKYLVIDTSSAKNADAFLSLLRESVGSIDVDILEPEYDVVDKMTSWLSEGSATDPFELEEGCVLKDMMGVGSKITADKHALDVEEIQKHIEEGKKVEELDLNWHERINFRLCSDFKIKKIKFQDVVSESVAEELGESDDQYAVYAASMYIMVEDFAEMLTDLLGLK